MGVRHSRVASPRSRDALTRAFAWIYGLRERQRSARRREASGLEAVARRDFHSFQPRALSARASWMTRTAVGPLGVSWATPISWRRAKFPSSWPGTTWVTRKGVREEMVSWVKAPPALPMTKCCLARMLGISFVQPRRWTFFRLDPRKAVMRAATLGSRPVPMVISQLV